jgi:hypothetical protein
MTSICRNENCTKKETQHTLLHTAIFTDNHDIIL